MTRPFLALAALLAVAACGTESATPERGPVAALGDTPWKLVAVNGEAVTEGTFVFRIAGGFISGQGPCNTINADYQGALPVFEIGTLITTRLVCDRLGLEDRVISGFQDARRAVLDGSRLTISGDGSPTLVFDPA
jgi:heat shock protein HslJ